MKLRPCLALPLLAVAPVMSACGSNGSGASTPGQRILQTQTRDYSTDYSHTTCREFRSTLSPGQRTAATAKALIRLRADDGRPPPTDADVDRFKASLDGACQVYRSQGLVQVAVRVYQQDHS